MKTRIKKCVLADGTLDFLPQYKGFLGIWKEFLEVRDAGTTQEEKYYLSFISEEKAKKYIDTKLAAKNNEKSKKIVSVSYINYP